MLAVLCLMKSRSALGSRESTHSAVFASTLRRSKERPKIRSAMLPEPSRNSFKASWRTPARW